jgi:hypothetical protein
MAAGDRMPAIVADLGLLPDDDRLRPRVWIGNAVTARAQFRDEARRPAAPGAPVVFWFRGPGNVLVSLPGTAVPGGTGLYECRYQPPTKGEWAMRAAGGDDTVLSWTSFEVTAEPPGGPAPGEGIWLSSPDSALLGMQGTHLAGVTIADLEPLTDLQDSDSFPAVRQTEDGPVSVRITRAAFRADVLNSADPAGTAAAAVAAEASQRAAGDAATAAAASSALAAHAGRNDNPHGTTAQQVGADPQGTAAAAIAAHLGTDNPHAAYLPRAASVAQLRALPSAAYAASGGVLMQGLAGGEFEWQADSLEADDGVFVVRPDDRVLLAPGRWVRALRDNTAYARWWGLTGAEVDAGPVLLAAMTASAQRGLAFDLGYRTYKVRNPLTLDPARYYRTQNGVFDMSVQDSFITVTGADELIRQVCPLPTTVATLTADASTAVEVSVDSTAQLAEDMPVLAVSDDNITSYAATYARTAELVHIQGWTGTRVRLEQQLQGQYRVVAAARLMAVQTAGGWSWRNFTLIGSGKASSRQQRGLASYCGYGNEYVECRFVNLRRTGIAETATCGTTGRDNRGKNDSPTPNGYLVSASGCFNFHLGGDLVGERNRHVFTSSRASSAYLSLCMCDWSLGVVTGIRALGTIVDTHPAVGPGAVAGVVGRYSVSGSQYTDVQTGIGADESSPVAFSQGAGLTIGYVKGTGTSTGNVVLQSYGWRWPNFKPTMTAGPSWGDPGRGKMVLCHNLTNQDGAGTSQECVLNVHLGGGRSAEGIYADCEQGDVTINVSHGRLIVTDSNAVRVVSSAQGRGRLFLNSLGLELLTTGNVIRLDGAAYQAATGQFGAEVQMRGGSISSVSNTARVDAGYLLLERVIGAENLAVTLVNGGAVERIARATTAASGRVSLGTRATASLVNGTLTVPTGAGRVSISGTGGTVLNRIEGLADGEVVQLRLATTTAITISEQTVGGSATNLRVGDDIALTSGGDSVLAYFDSGLNQVCIAAFRDNDAGGTWLNLGPRANVDIVNDTITLPANTGVILVGTEGGAATDQVTNILGGSASRLVAIINRSTSQTITYKNATNTGVTGSLRTGGDLVANSARDVVLFLYDSSDAIWRRVALGDNG